MGNVKNKPLSLAKQKEAAKDFESPQTERNSDQLRLAAAEKRRKRVATSDRTSSGEDKPPRKKKVA